MDLVVVDCEFFLPFPKLKYRITGIEPQQNLREVERFDN